MMRHRFPIAAILFMLAILAFPTVSFAQADDPVDPGHPFGDPSAPIAERHVYDYAGTLSESQISSLENDARRLQRFDTPALVMTIVWNAPPDVARAAADALRRDWAVETVTGADDGLVFLLVLPTREEVEPFALFSWGANALPSHGITVDTAAEIQHVRVDAVLAEGGHPFDALTSGLRRLVYTAIYVPAPLVPVSDAQARAQTVLRVVAPVVAIALVALLAARTAMPRTMLPVIVRHRTSIALFVVMALAVASVWAQSGVGVVAALVALAATTLRWVRDDPIHATGFWRRTTGSPVSLVTRMVTPLAVPLVLFIASMTINLAHVSRTDTHPDESRWINRANYATDLDDPFGPTWQDQYLTRGQPPLGSYLTGLGLILQGRDTETNDVWDFAYGTEWNTEAGANATDDDRAAARRTNAVIGAVTVVLVYAVGAALAGPVAGLAGALLLLLHPLQIVISSQALSDQIFALLMASAVLVAVRLGRQPSRATALALGILLGLGGAAKLSPLLLAVPVAAWGVGLIVLTRALRRPAPHAETIGRYLIWQPVIAFATFVIAYPYLWPAPIQRTRNLFTLRTTEMGGQANAWPEVAVPTPIHALARIGERLTVDYSATGDLAGDLIGLIGVPGSPWGIDLIIAVVGVAVFASLCLRRGFASGPMLAAVVLGGQVAAIVMGMRVDFYRYHLPIVIAVSILVGLAIDWVWQRVTAARTADNQKSAPSASAGAELSTERRT